MKILIYFSMISTFLIVNSLQIENSRIKRKDPTTHVQKLSKRQSRLRIRVKITRKNGESSTRFVHGRRQKIPETLLTTKPPDPTTTTPQETTTLKQYRRNWTLFYIKMLIRNKSEKSIFFVYYDEFKEFDLAYQPEKRKTTTTSSPLHFVLDSNFNARSSESSSNRHFVQFATIAIIYILTWFLWINQ